jgi:hypothetical protein
LAVGDYGLWKWSLAGNHQVLAVVFGLTLPPLALAFVWLLAVNAWRLLSELAYRRRDREALPRSARTANTRRRRPRAPARPLPAATATSSTERPARKLAA